MQIKNIDSKINILHILSPGTGNFGGIEAFLYQYYKYVDQKHIHFDFAFLGKNTMISRVGDEVLKNSKMYELNILESENNHLLNWIMLCKRIRQLADNNSYDIIEVHSGSPFIQIFSFIALLKIKVVKISHSHSISMEGKKTLARKIIYWACARFICFGYNYLFACSIVAGKALFGKNVDKQEKFYKINNAVDAKNFRSNKEMRNIVRNEFGLNDKNVIIGHVARLSEEKNQLFLIDVFKECLSLNSNAFLWIIGEGPMRHHIEKKILSYGLEDKIILFGERHNVSSIMQAMDVFVITSYYEGLCISAIESEAAGLPTFVSSGVPDECNISRLFKKISLDESEKTWASKIMSDLGIREDTYSETIKSGYDIVDAAKKLQYLYFFCCYNDYECDK